MVKHLRRYSKEEVARRGHAMYTRRIRRKLAGKKPGRVVAIDIKSGDFELADDTLTAAGQLRLRRPGAEIWLERVGYRTFHRIGVWHRKGAEG